MTFCIKPFSCGAIVTLYRNVYFRFKKLEERTDELTEKTKIKLEKNNKKKNKNDSEHAAQYTEKSPLVQNEEKRKKEDPSTQSSCSIQENNPKVKDLQELNQYLNINSHLQPFPATSLAPKSGLEKKINEAISLGDIETAVSLSDRLATREFGTKIAASFDAREYLKRKKEEEMSVKAKKKKKLPWGFEHKQRWEMKGNM